MRFSILSPYSGIFATLRLSALSASFRHDISAASETYSADTQQRCQLGFYSDEQFSSHSYGHSSPDCPQLFSFFIQYSQGGPALELAPGLCPVSSQQRRLRQFLQA